MELHELIAQRRAERGLTQTQLALLAGTQQQTVARIEKGETRHSRAMTRILRELEIDPPGSSHPKVAGAPLAEGANYRPPPDLVGNRDLPVYSAVEGGPGEMVITAEPIDLVPRPWYLGTVKEGYGVLVVGESMVPAYEPGDIAIVNPKLPPTRNKPFIVTSNDEDGEFRAMIKQLIGWSTDVWRVRQYNPPKDFDLLKRDWPKAVRVVGKYNG